MKRQVHSAPIVLSLCLSLLFTPTYAVAQGVATLEVGKPVEQTIKGGESHRYTIRLEMGNGGSVHSRSQNARSVGQGRALRSARR
jgi:hypothetical protein